MLFNSYTFLLGFLPAVLLAFALVNRFRPQFGVPLLGVASMVFYGWWNPYCLLLLCASIVFNFGIAQGMYEAGASATSARRRLLIAGVAVNLAALAYFKYAGFLLDTVGALSGSEFSVGAIVLPLGISFFTFTQIAFLVDAFRDRPPRQDFPSYLLFVTFFPHLIAGPIYHHKEMLPQYARLASYRVNAQDVAVGSTIFALGLFKKTVFADGIAPYADRMFAAVAAGAAPNPIEAWCGVVAFSLQIYFDFSGYSDMAIGLARLFGIALPLNFSSPYKSRSIIEFWRRWHMSLSRFLRDYLYIALGGNRRGRFRAQVNIGITMVLGGLWHGAAWTFVAWGAMHGALLMLNHGWRAAKRALGWREDPGPTASGIPSVLLTYVCVLLAWVLFRAGSLTQAWSVYRGMFGFNLATRLGAADFILAIGDAGGLWCASLLAVVWFAPNTQQIMGPFNAALEVYPEYPTSPASGWWQRLVWRPSVPWAVAMAAVTASAAIAMLGSSPFLYFQF